MTTPVITALISFAGVNDALSQVIQERRERRRK